MSLRDILLYGGATVKSLYERIPNNDDFIYRLVEYRKKTTSELRELIKLDSLIAVYIEDTDEEVERSIEDLIGGI